LRSKDIILEQGTQAGLLAPKKDGTYYDRFRNRVIFPISDLNHRIIGFGGRVLDNTMPKYINTPETPIYHKGGSLYGLDSAHRDVREKGLAILVEGYMDMLVLRQNGIPNAVATLGTALTSDQVRKLKGYTKELIVLFDPDEAGREAALKSFPLCLNEGVSAKVLVLPQGEDPDSFVNKYGSDAFEELLGSAMPIFDFYLVQALAHMDTGVDGKVKVVHEVLPILIELEQGATRSLYVRQFSEKTGIDEGIVWEELRHWGDRKAKRDTSQLKRQLAPAQDPKKYGSDIQFLNLLVHYPQYIDSFKDQEWELVVSDPEVAGIIKALMEHIQTSEDLERIDEFLGSSTAKKQFRVTMMSEPFFVGEMVDKAANDFRIRIAEVKISQSMREAKAEGNIEMLNRLIRAKQDLDLTR
jgi:DNA primase